MKLLAAFFRLIRWPNLFFIAVTQLLYYYAIVEPLTKQGIGLNLNRTYVVWLIIASLLIAAAGYIINDSFDLNIDQVNKPSRLIIHKTIKRRLAMLTHLAMTLTAVCIGHYSEYGTGSHR